MAEDAYASLFVGALTTLLALVGLFMWAWSTDLGAAIFGCGLTVFGAAFDFWLIKVHFDSRALPARRERP